MVTAGNLEDSAGVREFSLLNVLNPGAIDSYGDVVLGLAGYSAGMTTDALSIVDDESIFHRGFRLEEDL
jgi:hypothetical protein